MSPNKDAPVIGIITRLTYKRSLMKKELSKTFIPFFILIAFLFISCKTHSIDIDVLANYPKQFRMEVSALLGTHVASFVLSGPEIKYTLFNEN